MRILRLAAVVLAAAYGGLSAIYLATAWVSILHINRLDYSLFFEYRHLFSYIYITVGGLACGAIASALRPGRRGEWLGGLLASVMVAIWLLLTAGFSSLILLHLIPLLAAAPVGAWIAVRIRVSKRLSGPISLFAAFLLAVGVAIQTSSLFSYFYRPDSPVNHELITLFWMLPYDWIIYNFLQGLVGGLALAIGFRNRPAKALALAAVLLFAVLQIAFPLLHVFSRRLSIFGESAIWTALGIFVSILAFRLICRRLQPRQASASPAPAN